MHFETALFILKLAPHGTARIHPEYSGQFMYGGRTTAIEIDTPHIVDLFSEVMLGLMDAPEVLNDLADETAATIRQDLKGGWKVDQLGKGCLLY